MLRYNKVFVFILIFALALGKAGIISRAADETGLSALVDKEADYISEESIVIYPGESRQLNVIGYDGILIWSSIDEDVAVVGPDGFVTGIKSGETYVIAEGEEKSYVCRVVVKKPGFARSEYELTAGGDKLKLELMGIGQNVIVTYESTNPEVVRIKNGYAEGVNPGTAYIIASYEGEKCILKLIVSNPDINCKSITLGIGEEFTLEMPGISEGVTFKSSSEETAVVDKNGLVRAAGIGKCEVTAEFKGVVYTCSIDVIERRMYISEKEYAINDKMLIFLTLKDRKKGESIIIETESLTDGENVINAKVTALTYDTVTIRLDVSGNGVSSVRLIREDGLESIELTVYAKVSREMSTEEIYRLAHSCTVEINSYDAAGTLVTGSGFFIGKGRLLTNYHVIEYAASKLTVTGYNGISYEVEGIESIDKYHDLAVILTEETNESFLFFSNDEPVTGEAVYNMGSPAGYEDTFGAGIVSYADRVFDGIHYIQNSAPISQSSGGGPLLNSKGEVTGINTLTVSAGQNINFAVKAMYYKGLGKNYTSLEEFYSSNSEKLKSDVIIIQ